MQLTNDQKIGLSMAVFLATDNYDYDPRPNCISATGLLKPPRQVVLSKRVDTAGINLIKLLNLESGEISCHEYGEVCTPVNVVVNVYPIRSLDERS
jgi:hypothetical protein